MVQRTFLVTGASKGNGLAISKRLAAAGHEVAIWRRDEGFAGDADGRWRFGRNCEFDKQAA
jgi:NAD(P)-dependent dehydrogenase (short-subunit alcohol dehydrogenase family)